MCGGDGLGALESAWEIRTLGALWGFRDRTVGRSGVPRGSLVSFGRPRGKSGDGWPGRVPGTETPSGHTRSDAYPNSPRRKEWEALTRFSASAISWTASRSFPALSMSPAATATASSAVDARLLRLRSPLARRGAQERRARLAGSGSAGLRLGGGNAQRVNYSSQQGSEPGGMGTQLVDCQNPGFQGGRPRPR